jgi:pimeloyl-ACP methyl ester carboxylesterase
VKAPTLLIVGAADVQVLELNRRALELLGAAEKRLEIVPGATHLFEEPGALEQVAKLATAWFKRYLGRDDDDR